MKTPNFPVVIIGASAGGLKAIETILYHLPEKTGMAFIIIQHLSRKYKSLMKEILEKVTPMPVNVAVDRMALKPNEIFLNPPGYELSLENYQIHLGEQNIDQIPSFVIDTSFHSIGRNLKEKAIGLILSGTGSDGSRGIRTI
ncbi:MAG: chemotaxis protein CheB, partial [Bacteroidota bacterium]